MKTAVILGGSGLTGKKILWQLYNHGRYSRIILPVRKPMDIIHQKLEQVLYDFENPDPAIFKGADEVFCCLGSTLQQAGSKANFYTIDYKYVTRLAALAHGQGVKRFALLSSIGADAASKNFYLRTKGEVEAAVSNMGFESCFIFRPSVLTGTRDKVRPRERLSVLFMTVFRFSLPDRYRPIESRTVAQAMIRAMNSAHQKGLVIFESDAIKNLVKELMPKAI